MEPSITGRYNDDILHQALRRYGVRPEDCLPLGGFESYVYEITASGRQLILRLAHSLRRSPDLIHGEVDWINFLADRDIPAARALPSLDGELVEAIDDGHGGAFLATAFVKAPGRPLWQSPTTTPLLESYGRLLGRIHAASKQYQPANPAWERPQWDDPIITGPVDSLPPEEGEVARRYEELFVTLRTLPRGRHGFGLVHCDAHGGNIFNDDGRLTLFDFDDCCYHWFAYDIAITLFYQLAPRGHDSQKAAEFMTPFLRGYRQENDLDPIWQVTIPHFLKEREIDLYAAILRSVDMTTTEEPWILAFMDGRRERILERRPFLVT